MSNQGRRKISLSTLQKGKASSAVRISDAVRSGGQKLKSVWRAAKGQLAGSTGAEGVGPSGSHSAEEEDKQGQDDEGAVDGGQDEIVEGSVGAEEAEDRDAQAKVNNTVVSGRNRAAHKVGLRRHQKPSVKMKDFVEHRAQGALEELLDHERGPREGLACAACHQKAERWYRCADCWMPPTLCRACLVDSHAHNPFHFVQEWDLRRKFWRREPLAKLGVALHLGHEGRRCMSASTEPRTMTIVSENGIHRVKVLFCQCRAQGSGAQCPEATQLLRMGLWPSSWENPESAFEIRMLKTFSVLANEAHVSAYDYIESLRKKTDFIFPGDVKDRYREFLTAHRSFAHITAIKRHGGGLEDLVYASLAVLCPACPQPGENMDPEWRSREEQLRFLDALFYAVDGNFHANLKQKPYDADDVPLSKGAGYFVDEDAFAAYAETLGPLEPEPSTCHKFAAMGEGQYWGKVSGTVGLFCARHMFALPGGHVDLQKGERFANVDLAVVSGLQRWMDLLMHVSAYDINCQYRINFVSRLKAMATKHADLKLMSVIKMDYAKGTPWTLAGVGKFHLAGHKPSCRYKWSFNYLPGSAMTDGEAAERVWAVLNFLGLRTREMNPGHRHDVMNQFYSYMNVNRVHGVAQALVKKYSEARRYLQEFLDALASLEEGVVEKWDKDTLETWRKEEARFKKDVVDMSKHKTLVNPYDLERTSGKSKKAMVEELKSATKGEKDAMGLVKILEEGMKIEGTKAGLLREVEKMGLGAAEDSEVQERCRKLEKAASGWAEKADDLLGANIARARKEAGSAVADVGLRNLAMRVRQVGDEEEEDEEDDTFEESIRTEDNKRKRGPSATKPQKKQKRARVEQSALWQQINAVAIVLPSSCVGCVLGEGCLAHKVGVQRASRCRGCVLNQECLKAAVEAEIQLRKGQANDALDDLRTHLITNEVVNANLKKRSKRAKEGKAMTTRHVGTIISKSENIILAAREYRRAYAALVALKAPLGDVFKPLPPKAVKPFVTSSAEQRLGDSKAQPSWIWQNLRFLDTAEVMKDFGSYTMAAIKVHWFRTSATKERWQEQKNLLLSEMRRVVRKFKHDHHRWLVRGEEREIAGCYGAAAYARKQAYRYERLLGGCRTSFQSVPEIDVDKLNHWVEAGWAKDGEYVWNDERYQYERNYLADVD